VRTFGQTKLGICFDDFGTEVDKKHYGNEANVMTEIILARFMSHENLMAKTHFTTNINSDIIEERYGIRVRSRLREMVNLVEFPDNSIDRRK
jgi:DNA replication protein DnaC